MRTMLVGLILVFLSGCTSPMTLPSSGRWDQQTVTLGPVVVCKGGNLTFTPKGCNQWPMSLPSMPAPEIHYAELRAEAADKYSVDAGLIVLKNVVVKYNSEIRGTIRGWKASAIAGKVIPEN